VRETEQNGARHDTDGNGRATADGRQALCQRAKDHAAKEPLLEEWSDERGQQRDQQKARAVRRFEQMVFGLVERFEVKWRVQHVDCELACDAEQHIEHVARAWSPLIGQRPQVAFAMREVDRCPKTDPEADEADGVGPRGRIGRLVECVDPSGIVRESDTDGLERDREDLTG
jgi:hypothetical protein